MSSSPHPDSLQQFLIPKVHPAGRQLGVGSYGSVEELFVDGVVCAGKRLHSILLDTDNIGVHELERKYEKECQLMSRLRHPHIVQFLGLCYLPGSQLPILVMEKLLTNLDSILESETRDRDLSRKSDIPLGLKLSIVTDVACGLVYLHKRDPPVIHRDITAKNVLLNSAMVAKISDLGNARIAVLRPEQLAQTLTRYPGTLVYMPPEALYSIPGTDVSHYGPSIDIFSFGHLLLYTITGVFPKNLLPHNQVDPQNPDRLIPLTELERRSDYVYLFHQQLGVRHPLGALMERCLHNSPAKRPSANDLLRELQKTRDRVRVPYENLSKLDMIRELSRLQQQEVQGARLGSGGRDLEALRRQVQQLQSEKQSVQETLSTQLRAQQLETQSVQARSEDLSTQLRAQQREHADFQRLIDHLRATIQQREADHQGMMQRYHHLQDACQQQEDRLKQQHASQLHRKDAQMRQLMEHARALESVVKGDAQRRVPEVAPAVRQNPLPLGPQRPDAIIRGDVQRRVPEVAPAIPDQRQNPPPLGPQHPQGMPRKLSIPVEIPVHEVQPKEAAGYTLEWEECTDLPVGTRDSQAAFLNNKLYVGGGEGKLGRNIYVCDFTATKRTWLPILTKAINSAIAVYRSKLILVGGCLETDVVTNQLWELQVDDTFTQPILQMKYTRLAASAVSVNHYLVVAGGMRAMFNLETVEIFDGDQWYETAPLPIGCSFIKSILSRGVVYLTGGRPQKSFVYYASLQSLIANVRNSPTKAADGEAVWKTLADLPYNLCSCAVFKGTLIAVGGIDSGIDSDATATSSPVHMYSPQTKAWVKVGEMPQPTNSTCTITLPSGELIVIGGKTSNTNWSTKVYKGY